MLLILMKHKQPEIDKTFSYVKDPFESKYRLLIYERENVGIKEKKIQKYLLIIHEQLMISIKI